MWSRTQKKKKKKPVLLPRAYADISCRGFGRRNPLHSVLVACVRNQVYLGYAVSVTSRIVTVAPETASLNVNYSRTSTLLKMTVDFPFETQGGTIS